MYCRTHQHAVYNQALISAPSLLLKSNAQYRASVALLAENYCDAVRSLNSRNRSVETSTRSIAVQQKVHQPRQRVGLHLQRERMQSRFAETSRTPSPLKETRTKTQNVASVRACMSDEAMQSDNAMTIGLDVKAMDFDSSIGRHSWLSYLNGSTEWSGPGRLEPSTRGNVSCSRLYNLFSCCYLRRYQSIHLYIRTTASDSTNIIRLVFPSLFASW